jgi:hypothetical protein
VYRLRKKKKVKMIRAQIEPVPPLDYGEQVA